MEVPDSMQIVHAYMQQIDSLAAVRDSLNAVGVQPTFDAYYYRLVLPSTLYMGMLRDLMSTTTAHTQDEKLLRLSWQIGAPRLYIGDNRVMGYFSYIVGF